MYHRLASSVVPNSFSPCRRSGRASAFRWSWAGVTPRAAVTSGSEHPAVLREGSGSRVAPGHQGWPEIFGV